MRVETVISSPIYAGSGAIIGRLISQSCMSLHRQQALESPCEG